jgi:hypothetical protein
MIDGLPINNVLFGGPAFDITTEAIEQLDLVKGGFQAQYGNMLSGVINQATKEGSETLKGSIRFQSSAIAGALGSTPDERRNFDQFEGFVTGPIPGTQNKLRYLISGRQYTGADRVLEFDDHVLTPFERSVDEQGRVPYHTDLIPGWQAIGFNTKRDLYGKLTFQVTPAMKVNVGGLYFEQARKPYNWAFLSTDQDFATVCREQYPSETGWCDRMFVRVDTNRMEDLYGQSFLAVLPFMVYNSVDRSRNMLWGKWDYNFGNSVVSVAAGRLNQDRLSCNWLSGVCMQDDIRNFTTVGAGFYVPRNTRSAALSPWVGPATGAENFFGSDTMHTNMARADFTSQLTDHHNVKTGVFYQRHDFVLHEARNNGRPRDAWEIARNDYRAKPWDVGVYIQDRIEFDFLTIDVGVRLDHFNVPATYWTNPLDPTNGTTAFEVCEGTASTLGVTTPYTYTAEGGGTLSGISACSLAVDANGNDFLMDSARAVAFQDDFSSVKGRTEISPRLGFSFPVTQSVRMFANYGRFTQNPLYNNLLQRTGIGRIAEKDTTSATPAAVVRDGETLITDQIRAGDLLEGTPLGPDTRALCGSGSFCVGALFPLIGNPRLRSEVTTSYEIGLLAELFDDYGLSVIAFNKDQTGLTGARRGGVLPSGVSINDPGETYGRASPSYYVLVNTDYQTVRGLEIGLRRRVKNYWGFDANLTYQQAWTNAAPPDLEVQKLYEGDQPAFREIRSEIDLPLIGNFTFRYNAGEASPTGGLMNNVLRDLTATMTARWQTGYAYTPQLTRRNSASTIVDNPADRAERNSGTAPPIYGVDLFLEKALRLANLRYVAFARVNNVFDWKTCQQVYPTSGRCESGSLSLERGPISGFQNGSPGETISLSGASTFSSALDRPDYFNDRRTITAGVRVSF